MCQVKPAKLTLMCKVLTQASDALFYPFQSVAKRGRLLASRTFSSASGYRSPSNGSVHRLPADAIRFGNCAAFLQSRLGLRRAPLVTVSWPHFRPAFTLFRSQLAVLALLPTCATAPPTSSISMQVLASVWKRRRWALWVVGTLFAILRKLLIADEIYPFVR